MTFNLKITNAQQLIEQDRAKALSDLADIRWQCAMAGVVLPGGLHIPGDEVTRLSLSGAVSALQRGMISEPLAWKTPTGFVELTQPKLQGRLLSLRTAFFGVIPLEAARPTLWWMPQVAIQTGARRTCRGVVYQMPQVPRSYRIEALEPFTRTPRA